MKFVKKILCRLFPRYKLRCILKALKLEARPWQIEFALGRSNAMPEGRATGKTVAVMLRALMAKPKEVKNLEKIMMYDSDYARGIILRREQWYRHEYHRYSNICTQSGIPVPKLTVERRLKGSWEVQ